MRARHILLPAIGAFALLAVAEIAITRAILSSEGVSASGVAAIGGPFKLVDDTGAPVTEATLAGKPYAIYFGYTYCPDVCPTTLADLSRWIAQLGPSANKMNYVFVTVDPGRDTPKVMHEYLESFDRRIRGFTGSSAQIAVMANDYKVYYKKIPSAGGYLMDHSAMIYLMDANGRFAGIIPYQDKDAVALAKLKSLIAGAANS